MDRNRLERTVAEAQKARQARERDYREQALKLYPWVCGRCGRTFTRENLQQLTVHHRDHNHDNNPTDGSNWELLCLYCHDNEHQRLLEAGGPGLSAGTAAPATHRPFEALRDLLKRPG
jgi:5-methylcytosine-specific restriction endonuclease McrA